MTLYVHVAQSQSSAASGDADLMRDHTYYLPMGICKACEKEKPAEAGH